MDVKRTASKKGSLEHSGVYSNRHDCEVILDLKEGVFI